MDDLVPPRLLARSSLRFPWHLPSLHRGSRVCISIAPRSHEHVGAITQFDFRQTARSSGKTSFYVGTRVFHFPLFLLPPSCSVPAAISDSSPQIAGHDAAVRFRTLSNYE